MAGNGIILHHPAMTYDAINNRRGTEMVKYLRDLHTNNFGWSDIGYHYVFNRDDNAKWQLYQGRPISRNGAHARGYNHWVGICVCVDYPQGSLESDELYSELAREIKSKFSFPLNEKTILGHDQVNATKCPGNLKIEKVIKAIREPMPQESLPEMVVNFPSAEIKAKVINNRAYIPVAELTRLGHKVSYDAKTNQVNVEA